MLEVLDRHRQQLRSEVAVLDEEARILRTMRLDLARRRLAVESKLVALNDLASELAQKGSKS